MTALLATLALLSVTPDQVPDPRPRGGWVSDSAAAIDDATEARLEAIIESLHADLGVEVAVVTVHQTDGAPREFATALFNRWGIGDAKANNGLLVLLVMGARRLEMETGYGLEPILPDAWLGRMQTGVMVPHFRQGDFAAGLVAGLEAVAKRLRARPEDAQKGATGPAFLARAKRAASTPWPLWIVWSLWGGLIGGIALVGLIVRDVRRRRRLVNCDVCGGTRALLDEQADDAHLDPGNRTEERIGSVNYDVYICGGCSGSAVDSQRRWFSEYSTCLACGYRTLSVTSTTLVSATTSREGEVEVTEDCAHCDWYEIHTRTIPRIVESDSSSSSSWSSGGASSSGSSSSSRSGGGGSWGGGSSGGGGAGASW
ncbi:MAG: TPM domain-containing protein [Myxococcota bacterium]